MSALSNRDIDLSLPTWCDWLVAKTENSASGGKREARRERVLEQAAHILNRYGVSYASLPAVAERLGVSRAALYYYFKDQEDLVFQSYIRSCARLSGQLELAITANSNALDIVDGFVDGMLGASQPEIASITDLAYLTDERRAEILGRLMAVKSRVGEVLALGIARQQVRDCAVGIIAPAIISLVSWLPMARFWRSSDSLSDADMIAAIKLMLRGGIAADRSLAIRPASLKLAAHNVSISNVFDQDALLGAKQEMLLSRASWLFNLKGVDATSLDEIAARVGVTKKVIYHNVGDKETLVAECYRRSFRFYESIARQCVELNGPQVSTIMGSTIAYAEASLREDIAPLAPLNGIAALPAAVQEEINTSSAWLMDQFLTIYERGKADGSVRDVPSRAVIAVNPGCFEWLPRWFEALTPAERTAAPAELARLNLVGLAPLS